MSRTVRDTAAYLDAVSGGWVGDLCTPPIPNESFLNLLSRDPKGLRIVFTTSLPFGSKLDNEVDVAVSGTARLLADRGHAVEQFDTTFGIETWFEARIRAGAVQTAGAIEAPEAAFGAKLEDGDLISGLEPFNKARVERGRATTAVTHVRDIELVQRGGRDIASSLIRFDAFLCLCTHAGSHALASGRECMPRSPSRGGCR
ncbi:Asp-tRNA(Asn)/Glu-tRNA(Gln) amidotransferase A subunit family amidase [Bradyrhizobium elkanii]